MKTHGSTQPAASGRRIILFCLPVQGHINPMFHLATILHSQGFKIIIIHPELYSPNHSNYPHFTFKSIADRFSEFGIPDKPDGSLFSEFLNENCVDSFTECLSGLLGEADEPPVACLISDAEYYFTQQVADLFKIPRLVSWACTIHSVLVYRDLSFFYEKGYFNLSIRDSEYEARVPEHPFLKVKDILKMVTKPKGMADYQTKVVTQIKASSGIIWSSFKEPEEPILESLSHDFPIPRFTLGPRHKYVPSSTPSSVLQEDRTFFSWLDAQPPKSVIYASFGSVSRMTKLEFQEVAYALANVGFPFLWVVRPGLVSGSEWLESLPERFLQDIGERGRIVKWCPQKEVLAHPATGCFWTHSGWNSTLESICEGVPMICSPLVVGQPVIARYVSDVWKIGVLLEDGLERAGIERAVRRVMLDKEGEEIRERISRLKEEVTMSFNEGGSSNEALKSLVDYISSF